MKPKGEVTKLVPRSAWKGCDKCWREGVAHNGREAAFGGPCYIRFPYCEERPIWGMRLRPGRKRWKGVRKDRQGRWVWTGLPIEPKIIDGKDRQQMQALDAIIRIHNDLPPLKKELKQLRRDIEKLIRRKDEARDHLYLVVNAVNSGLSMKQIKRIAVVGMAKSK